MSQPNNAVHYEPGTLEHHIARVMDAHLAHDSEKVAEELKVMYAAGFEAAAAGMLEGIVAANATADIGGGNHH